MEICEPRPANEARAPDMSAAVTTRPRPTSSLPARAGRLQVLGRMPLLGDRRVRRRGDQDDVVTERVVERPPLAAAEPAAAEAHVDHRRPRSGRIDQRRDHARAGEVALLQNQPAVGSCPRDPGPVVRGRAGQAADMRPVADLVAGALASSRRGRAQRRPSPPRSGWVESMPESITPTSAPAPRLRSQAAGKCSRCRYHWYGCPPTFGSGCDIAGSLGTRRGVCRYSGSTATTRGSRSSRAASSATVSPGRGRTVRTPTSGTAGPGPAQAVARDHGTGLEPCGRGRARRGPIQQHQRAPRPGGLRASRPGEGDQRREGGHEETGFHLSEGTGTAGGRYRSGPAPPEPPDSSPGGEDGVRYAVMGGLTCRKQ